MEYCEKGGPPPKTHSAMHTPHMRNDFTLAFISSRRFAPRHHSTRTTHLSHKQNHQPTQQPTHVLSQVRTHAPCIVSQGTPVPRGAGAGSFFSKRRSASMVSLSSPPFSLSPLSPSCSATLVPCSRRAFTQRALGHDDPRELTVLFDPHPVRAAARLRAGASRAIAGIVCSGLRRGLRSLALTRLSLTRFGRRRACFSGNRQQKRASEDCDSQHLIQPARYCGKRSTKKSCDLPASFLTRPDA